MMTRKEYDEEIRRILKLLIEGQLSDAGLVLRILEQVLASEGVDSP
jgi:hypothetical protein